MGSLVEARRRLLLAQGSDSGELYPIGTDLVSLYIGRGSNGLGYFNSGYTIQAGTGDYVATAGNNAASPIYLPIEPAYRYQKNRAISALSNGGRMYNFTWYDADFNFISQITENNFNIVDLPAPPSNARYARFATHRLENNWAIAIVRIA